MLFIELKENILSIIFSLTCLKNHQNLLHLTASQLTTLTIDSFVYKMVHYVNRTLIMFNHFTRYSRSMNAILSYISNEIILNIYTSINDFYLETKQFCLSKAIQYSLEIEYLLKILPYLSDSITYFSSNEIRTIIYVLNHRLRQLLSLWINSPIEYKLMKSIVTQIIELIDQIRYHIDDKLDFLIPRLQIYTPRLPSKNVNNQSFLLTWSKYFNVTSITDED